MKRLVVLLLSMALAGSVLFLPARAADPVTAKDSAQLLYDLGLFQGTGVRADGTPVFDLDRAPTRAEAVTMLVRLLGAEDQAMQAVQAMPFTDVPEWARPYVSYAYQHGLTDGVADSLFGSSHTVTAAQYLTFVLRALGYEDGTDFFWSSPWTLAEQKGLSAGEYNSSSTFLRGDVAVVSANALTAERKTGNQNLLEYLVAAGVITDKNLVVWGYSILDPILEGYTTVLFYPVKGSPGTFSSFKVDKVTVNGLSCQTKQATTTKDVDQWMRAKGYSTGGFCYIEVTFNQATAKNAAKEFFTENGKKQPWLVFQFNCTGVRTDGIKVAENFSMYQAPI